MELLAFPPHRPMSSTALALHLALMTLGLLSLAGLFLRARRPAAGWEPLVWLAVVIAAPVLYAVGTKQGIRETDRPFLIGYVLFSMAIGFAGVVISCRRLVQQGRGTAVALGVGALVALGLLIVCSLPTVPRAREAARGTQCRGHLKYLGLAFHNWHSEHGRFPDAVGREADSPMFSWRVAILPYIDQPHMYEQYDRRAEWDDVANLPVPQTHVSVLSCPSRFVPLNGRDDQGRYLTAYAVVRGPETIFPDGRGRSLDEIADGASNTAMIVEACGLNLVWTRPKDVELGEHPVGVNLPGATPSDSPAVLSSYHLGSSHLVLADGGVRTISEDIDPQILKAILTATGGEQLHPADF